MPEPGTNQLSVVRRAQFISRAVPQYFHLTGSAHDARRRRASVLTSNEGGFVHSAVPRILQQPWRCGRASRP